MCGAGRWVPKQERSRSLALVYSGMYTGSILGLALSPHMVETTFIQSSFLICRFEAHYSVETTSAQWHVHWLHPGTGSVAAHGQTLMTKH